MFTYLRSVFAFVSVSMLTACRMVGPDYSPPTFAAADEWSAPVAEELVTTQEAMADWWMLFEDEELSNLVNLALIQNNTAEIAALRVLESRARLGIASGARYPQAQFISGDASYVDSPLAIGQGGDFARLGLGTTIGWEPDFWGRYRYGIEAADAAFLGSVAAYDQVVVLLIGQVVDTYTLARSIEAQIGIAEENLARQQRSYDIAETLFNNGADSELDMMQAQTLLLSTQSSIPELESLLRQVLNALNVLIGRAPGTLPEFSDTAPGLPVIPDQLSIGLPGDALRLRPDVRLAELQARSQSALVGLSTTNLYPSFSLGGNLSVTTGGPFGDSDFGSIFSNDDALTWVLGASFKWPFLNYGRIRNDIRVQDARLQQALINYGETAIRAAREVEDALAAFYGARLQTGILEQVVTSAQRANELSLIRYQEGLSSYERVLDSQQALFRQQQRLVDSQTNEVRSLISLFQALGAGWQVREGLPQMDETTVEQMRQRVDWADYLEQQLVIPDDAGIRDEARAEQ